MRRVLYCRKLPRYGAGRKRVPGTLRMIAGHAWKAIVGCASKSGSASLVLNGEGSHEPVFLMEFRRYGVAAGQLCSRGLQPAFAFGTLCPQAGAERGLTGLCPKRTPEACREISRWL